MLLKLKSDPVSYGVKPQQFAQSPGKKIFNKIKNLVFTPPAAISAEEIYIDTYFYDSYFTPYVRINSYYGGGQIAIGAGCMIMGNLNIEAPSGNISIGEKTYIGSNTQLNSINSIKIGNNVLIAANVVIQDHNSHSTNYLERRQDIDLSIARFLGKPNMNKNFSLINSKNIEIGDDAWVGYGAIILKGVRIGKRAIVGAGSVVTKNVPDDGVVAGNPAQLIKN